MANRPVFVSKNSAPYYNTVNIEFTYNGGFAAVQKQKNIMAIHNGFKDLYPQKNVLEISSKSMQEIGVPLSAFHLLKTIPSVGKRVPVENVFQGGKKFVCGGPFIDLYDVTPKEAKRDERLKTSGKLTAFCYEGSEYPLEPKTAFYDWIYINALLENAELEDKLLEFDAFTDIEFNPEKSINCQAKAAAVFVSLSRMTLIDKVKDFNSFINLYHIEKPDKPTSPKHEPVEPTHNIQVGDIIHHKIWGKGRVLQVSSILKATFESVGEKSLGVQWVVDNCKITKE